MLKVECKNVARIAASVGLGLSLAFATAPVIAVAADDANGADNAVLANANTESGSTNLQTEGDVQAIVVASDGTTTRSYDDAKKAAEELQDGEQLILQSDYVGEGGLSTSARDIVIDLNGHSVTSTKKTSSSRYGYAIAIAQKPSGARDNRVIIKNTSSTPSVLKSSVDQLTMKSGDSRYSVTVSIEGNITCATQDGSTPRGVSFGTGALLIDSPSARALVTNGGFSSTAADGTSYLSGSLSTALSIDADGVVTLVNDYEGDAALASGTMSGTLDLGEHHYVTTAAAAVNMNYAGTELTIRNGTVQNTRPMPADPVANPNDVPAGVQVFDANATDESFKLTLDNVYIGVNNGGYGIVTQGNNMNVDISLSGVTIVLPETGMGIYFPSAESELSITDSVITAGTGIGIKGGTVTIGKGVVINATGERLDPTSAVSSGINETGDAIYVEGNYTDRRIDVNISDGIFSSEHGYAVQMLFDNGRNEDSPATIKVSGGSYSSLIDEKYCADGFKLITTPNADGQYVVAKATDVVQVGAEMYDSIDEALDAASNGATIKLLADVYEDVTIPDGRTVTLDLAGFTLTNNSGHTITNNGNLTITDSAGGGVVDNVTHRKAAVFNAEGATADIQAGTFMRSKEAGSKPGTGGDHGNSYYTILNQGTMTLGDKVVVESKLAANGDYSTYSSVIANGWQDKDTPKGDARVTAKLTINGARIEGGLYLKNDRYGELEMKSGYVKGTAAGIFNYGTASITGGTVEAKLEDRGAVWNYKEPTYGEDAAPAKLTIKGGALNADNNQFAIRVTLPKGGGDPIRTSITITGGEINGEIGAKEGDPKLSPSQFKITGGTYTENPVDLMDAADNSVVRHEGNGGFSVLERKDLQAGTYEVPKDADPLTAKDFEPGLVVTIDPETGQATATRPQTPAKGEHAVKAEQAEGGKVSVTPARADEGDEVTITATPDKGQEVRSVTVTTKDGKTVKVAKGDKANTWTFDMPDAEVTVKVTFGCDGGELCPTHKFDDVSTGAWYHDVVDWAVEEGLLSGYSDGTLGPDGTLSRAQLATVLWRQAGEPEAKNKASFADCDPEAFYAEAVAWADEAGIIAGYGDGTNFGPEDPVTREQLATILWRQAGEPEGKGDLAKYPDGDEATDYAVPALEWAVEEGVLSGFGDGTLAPGGVLSRAMLAAMLQRIA